MRISALMGTDAKPTGAQLAAQRAYLQAVKEKTGWNGKRFADEAGVSASTINRALQPGYKFLYRIATIRKLAAASGLPPPPELSTGQQPAVNTSLGNVPQSRDVSSGGVTMSEDEERLLKIYRKLDAENRAMVLQKVTALFIDRVTDDTPPLSTRRRA